MPVDSSALPWWGWLLSGVGCGIASLAASRTVDNTENGAWAMAWWLVGIIAGLGSLISFAIGVFRFAKWAWS
jgi:hypothetical protein